MAYKMFSIGLVVLAFVGMSLCQSQQQLNAGISSQYLQTTKPQGSFQGSSAALQQVSTKFEDIESQSDRLSSSNLEVPQQSQSYQDAVQQQNLAQTYQTAFENKDMQYSIVTPNSYGGNQDSQQYYVPATQQSAAPQFITKESNSAVLPAVIPGSISAQAQSDYKQQFTTSAQTQQDILGTNAAQAEQEYRRHQEYRHQHLASLAQAQVEYKQQVAALEQAQLEYKQQFAAISQTQQELKNQFAAPVQAHKELIQQSTVLPQIQHELTKQFSTLAQAQQEYKQQLADVAQAQLEFKQQFTALLQPQKILKQQFVATNQIPHEYKQRFTVPGQQVYREQYAVPDQVQQDYRQRFVVPTPTYKYIQKSTAATATGPINYSYVAQDPATQIKSQTVAAVQPKFQYATIPQQYQPQQHYYTFSTGQIAVTEQPRVQQSATNQSSAGIIISTAPNPLNESIVYKSESTPTPRQQPKIANNNLRIIA